MTRWIGTVLWLLTVVTGSAAADSLATIKQRGTLVCGVKDSLPPFGYVDAKTRQIVGYDIDICKAIADRLGVRMELKPVTSAARVPQLKEGNVDLIAATMTKTPERAKEIDFSHTYFVTGQKFLVRKGTVRALKDMAGKKIGTAKGSTSEQNAKKAIPDATILSFDDYPQAFLALNQGKVVAVTTDEAILAGIRAKAPKPEAYEILDERLSDEPYGLGLRKGDTALLAEVNKTLLELERSGEAKRLFEKWFGPRSAAPLKRTFTITADK